MMDKLDQFLAYLKHERHALPNSVISYRSDLSMMLNYFKERNIELENVDHKVIRDYLLTLHKRKLKRTSIYKKVSCIKSFFKFCKERSWIRKDPAKIIEFPKFEKPIPSFLTEQEMERFLPLPILELRDYAILELLYATGIRGSELVGIDIDDLSLKDKAILIKGRRRRYVFFGWKAARCLKYYLIARRLLIDDVDEEKALFLNHSGKRIGLRAVERVIEKYWRLSGLAKKVTPRTFRHSFASHLLGRGAKSCFVQGFLGHKRLATTEEYLRIDIKHLKALHRKYHPRALEQPEKEIQILEDITYPYSQCDLIRY
jgi:site-specific recombinase XerD